MLDYTHVPYTGQSGQPSVVACGVIFAVVTPLVVAMRFVSRTISGVGIWWDDYVALVALPLAVAFNAIKLWELNVGFGARLPLPIVEQNLPVFLKTFYIREILYNTGLPFCKLSFLFLYRRIFPTKEIKYGVWILGMMVLAWFIGTEFAIIFQCTPISRSWNMKTPGKCYDLHAFLLGQAIPSIVTDFAIFTLPIKSVFQLQMPLGRKFAISSIFLLGLFAVFCSIIRLYYALYSDEHGSDPDNILYAYTLGDLWTDTEFQVSLICSCLPTIRPLLTRASKRLSSLLNSRFSSRNRTNGWWGTTFGPTANEDQTADDDRKYLKLPDSRSARDALDNPTGSPANGAGATGTDDVELVELAQYATPSEANRVLKGETIGVRRDVQVFEND